MKPGKKGWAILLALCIMVCSGCSGGEKKEKPIGANGYEVRDSQGCVIVLAQKPQRIVSLSIGADEILLELVAPERIAALTYWADDENVSNVVEGAKRVKNKVRANAETVIGLQPDLVLVPDWQPPELSQAMRDAGLPVYVFKSAKSVDEVRKNIASIAEAVGETAKGADLIQDMNRKLTEVAEKVKTVPEREKLIVARFSNMGGSGGIGSSFDDICRHAGVKNAAAIAGVDMNGTLSKEQLVQVNPDFLLLPAWDYSGKISPAQYRDEVAGDPALQSVKAIQNQRLVQVPDKYLFCTSQNIVKGVRGVAAAAYPKLFGPE